MHAYKRVTRVYSQTFRRCSCRKKRLHVKISECTGSKSSYLTCSPKSMAILVMASGSRKRIRGQYALRDRQSIMTNYDNNVEGIRPWRVALWLSASSCLKWNWKNWRHCHSQRFRWEGQANISHYIIMSFTRELNLTATKCWCRKPLKMSILVSERLKCCRLTLLARVCYLYSCRTHVGRHNTLLPSPAVRVSLLEWYKEWKALICCFLWNTSSYLS